ncbi:fungal-specific transcription factor domain-containing protein [Amylocarpus encephaloides]|uniref:Fungal-specific transcription factor domain-containing protein n=1 Tax=Amylocarpus encephaloides TaxID=45428 RepID=A0A9P8C4V6_9HELO|nr:fungal-specific transcription factor domain-containing protein [Amylocarpus encephaloides]
MNVPLRSKQGCWTCRLRKKKCDEGRPICATCESLSITCYGYDSKPEWMDGGETERAIAASIKQIVKHTSRRKGTGLGMLKAKFKGSGSTGQEEVVAPSYVPRIAPKPTIENASSPASSIPSSNGESSARKPGARSILDDSATNTTHETTPDREDVDAQKFNSSRPFSFNSQEEPILLMHFLDVVFYLQFPMYQPTIAEGGRGWLLQLLLRTKPLYHGALALASYHRGAMQLALERHTPNPCSKFIEQEQHLAICFREFTNRVVYVNKFVTDREPGDCCGIMASIVQLIFFELFANNREHSWQIHLNAAIGMIGSVFGDNITRMETRQVLDTAGLENYPFTRGTPTELESTTFNFFGTVIMWLDVVSCVTSGKTPRLLPLDQSQLSLQSCLRLESVMGCKDWAFSQIGRISALHERKAEQNYNAVEIEANNIHAELVGGLIESGLSSFTLTDSSDPFCAAAAKSSLVTRLFALMGCIYLHFVFKGLEQGSPCLDPTMVEVMTILRKETPRDLLPGLVCPLFVIGCAAFEEDKQFFRDVFSSTPLLDPSLDHRNKILPLLEKTWARRDTSHTTWSDVIELLTAQGPLLLV